MYQTELRALQLNVVGFVSWAPSVHVEREVFTFGFVLTLRNAERRSKLDTCQGLTSLMWFGEDGERCAS
jgi:hypothetical protein